MSVTATNPIRIRRAAGTTAIITKADRRKLKVALKVEGLSASAEVSYGLKGRKELDHCALLCSGLDIRGLSTEVAGGFVGCTVGMYAVAEKSCEDRAWFENFSY